MKMIKRKEIKKGVALLLSVAMIATFSINGKVWADDNNEETTIAENSEEETFESDEKVTLTFEDAVDALLKKGEPYDLKEVYEIYLEAPKQINKSNDWFGDCESQIKSFEEVLSSFAEKNHKDEKTGVYIGDDTPWYVEIHVKEVEVDELQKAYEQYRSEDDEEDMDDDDDNDDLDDDEDENNIDEEDDDESYDEDEDLDDEEYEETPLERDANTYKAYHYTYLGEAEYEVASNGKAFVQTAYEIEFYNGYTGEEYQCPEGEFIRLFVPVKRSYLGYFMHLISESEGEITNYNDYLFDSEETGLRQDMDEEDYADEDYADSDDEEYDEDDLDDDSDIEDDDYEEEERSAKENNDEIDYSKYYLVCETKTSGNYGVVLSEVVAYEEAMSTGMGNGYPVQTGDVSYRTAILFFGSSFFVAVMMLGKRKKKYIGNN